MRIKIDLIVNKGDESEVIKHFRKAYENCPNTIHMFNARKLEVE